MPNEFDDIFVSENLQDTVKYNNINYQRRHTFGNLNQSSSISRDVATAGGPMAYMIKSTEAFKYAERMMQGYDDWLNQLYMIPTSFRAAETLWGDITGKNEQNIINTFNQAMSAINNLVQQFRSWQNSLPSTQVEQFTEAGINTAVTGSNISPSSMSDTSAVTAPVQEVSNPIDVASTLVSSVGGFLSFVTSTLAAFSDLKSAKLGRDLVSKNIEQITTALDLAEQEAWNKQELHDYLMSTLGLVSTNPKSHKEDNAGNDIVLSTNESIAKQEQNIKSNSLSINPLNVNPDSEINIIGADGQTILSGVAYDVFSQLSQFSLCEWYYNNIYNAVNSYVRGQYMNLTYELQGQYLSNAMESQDEMNLFLKDFYSARSGISEGFSTTNLLSYQTNIAEAQAMIQDIESIMANFKLNHFSNIIKKGVTDWRYAPFINKAFYGVDFQDTFFHDPHNPYSNLKSGYKQFIDLIKGMNLF